MASVGLSPDSRYWWYFQDTCRLLNAFLVWKRQRFLLIEAGSYVWVWITSRLSYHGILCNIASSKAMDGYPCNLLLSPSSSPLFGTVTRIIGDMVSRLALGQYLMRLRYCALREVFCSEPVIAMRHYFSHSQTWNKRRSGISGGTDGATSIVPNDSHSHQLGHHQFRIFEPKKGITHQQDSWPLE